MMGLFFDEPSKEEQEKAFHEDLKKFDFDLVYLNNLDSLYKAWDSSSLRSFDIVEALMIHHDLQELIKTVKSSSDDNLDKIAKLKKLLDSNAITLEEYDAKKKQLLDL